MYVRGISFQNAVKFPNLMFNRKQVFNSEAPSLFKIKKSDLNIKKSDLNKVNPIYLIFLNKS